MRLIKILVTVVSTFVVSSVFASKIDELRLELSSHKKVDTNYVISLYKIAQYYETIASDSTIYYGNMVIKKSEEIGYKRGVSRAYNIIGSYYNGIGDYQKSLEFTIAAFKKAEEIQDSYAMSNYMNSLGNAYLGLNNVDKAMVSFKESYKIAKSVSNSYMMGISSVGIGNIHLENKESQLALESFKEAKRRFEEFNNPFLTTVSYTLLGNAYLEMGEYELALQNMREAVEGYDENENGYELGSTYLSMGKAKLKLKKAYEAIAFYHKALVIFQKRNALDNIKDTYLNISEAYDFLNNYKEAFEYHKMYMSYKDSVFNSESQKQIIEIEAKYETSKRQRELELKELKLSEQDLKLEAQNTRTNILTAGVFGIFILLAILFKGYRDKQKANKNLKVKSAIIEQKNKEITDSINYAKRIQAAILPPDKILNQHFSNHFILYRPKDIVAGDFYWLESYAPPKVRATDSEGNIVLFAAADCTGHGVPGALVSVVCHNALNRAVKEFGLSNPGNILDKTRELVLYEFSKSEEEVKDGMDISLCALQGNILSWSGANNPLWIINPKRTHWPENTLPFGEACPDSSGGRGGAEIKPNKQPIGKVDNPQPFTTHTVELEEGDAIYIFTDGYQDQFGGPKGKKFKASQLKELLLSIQHKTMGEQKIILEEAFENWKGDLEQIDDVCVIGVRL